jgi:hypothetical protein
VLVDGNVHYFPADAFRRGCPWLDHWVPLLIQTRPKQAQSQLEDILSECRYPEHATAALLLFQHLLRPVPEVKPDYLRKAIDPLGPLQVELELGTAGYSYGTSEAWRRHFLPNLQQFAGPLAAITAAHLEETALLSKAYGNHWDFVSMRFPDLNATSL